MCPLIAGSAGGMTRSDGDGTALGFNPSGGESSNNQTVGLGIGVADINSTSITGNNTAGNSSVLADASTQLISTSVTKVYSSDGSAPKGAFQTEGQLVSMHACIAFLQLTAARR